LVGQEVAALAVAARDVKPVPSDDFDIWERRLEQQLVNDPAIQETERLAIIRARTGKGFSKTGSARSNHDVASPVLKILPT
jgi:hypothetical protein